MKLINAILCASVLLSACATSPTFSHLEFDISGYPESAAATKLGPLKAVVKGKPNGSGTIRFTLGGETYDGQGVALDDSVTTTGASVSNTNAVGVTRAGRVGAVASNNVTESRSVVQPGSQRSVLNAVSTKGTRMKCEFVTSSKTLIGTGTCDFSNGAKYRAYSKPLQAVYSDGTTKPI
jgi:hypothetical protein